MQKAISTTSAEEHQHQHPRPSGLEVSTSMPAMREGGHLGTLSPLSSPGSPLPGHSLRPPSSPFDPRYDAEAADHGRPPTAPRTLPAVARPEGSIHRQVSSSA